MSSTLLLAYDFPPMGGGIARCLGEIAREYPRSSMLVSTGTIPEAGRAEAPGETSVDRIPVPVERLRTIGGLRRWSVHADRLARQNAVGFVWAGNLKPAGYPAHWVAARRRVPYGLITYGLDLLILERQVARSRLKRGIARRLMDGASVTVAISQWTASVAGRLREHLEIPPTSGSVRVVPLGADPIRFRPGMPTERVRTRYGLGRGRWLLTVARLAEHKGQVTGIGVLSALRDEFPDLGYAIAGTGPLREKILAEAARLGLTDRVRLLGEVPESELSELYNVASVYLGLSRETPTQVEGFGLSLVEAAGCGIPSVAGRGGGVSEAVRDGMTGLVVRPEVADAVAAVRALLSDQTLARRLGSGGRAEVERYFNWTRVVSDLRAIEAEITSRRAPAAR